MPTLVQLSFLESRGFSQVFYKRIYHAYLIHLAFSYTLSIWQRSLTALLSLIHWSSKKLVGRYDTCLSQNFAEHTDVFFFSTALHLDIYLFSVIKAFRNLSLKTHRKCFNQYYQKIYRNAKGVY